MDLKSKLESLTAEILEKIRLASTLDALEDVRVSALGKKGSISEVLRGLGSAPAEERPKIGAAANVAKEKIEAAFADRKATLEDSAIAESIRNERIDVTAPARRSYLGTLHPVTLTLRRLVNVFSRIGFDVVTGPEAETDFLNFDAVNVPKDHPARDMQDTFFLGPGVVLRTHTTPVQMRAMRSQAWPVRILCPGAVYRSDDDATHSPMFHQIEGLWVDRNVKMSDLKGTLEYMARELFGSDTKIRLRPSYFPFVEPGAEVDVSCFKCGGKESRCPVCKGTGWLEILGAGMVHPRLFEMAGYRAGEATGFAFGLGVERIAMRLYDIPDLRLFFQGDERFLRQFPS